MRFSILTVVLCLILGALPVLAQEAAPPAMPPEGATEQQTMPFYASGIRMGTSYCVGHTFDCGELNYIDDKIVAAANQCIRTSFGIEQQIMAQWNNESGEFENCVLPGDAATNAQNAREWAVCCIKKREEDTCDLVCTRYIDQKQK